MDLIGNFFYKRQYTSGFCQRLHLPGLQTVHMNEISPFSNILRGEFLLTGTTVPGRSSLQLLRARLWQKRGGAVGWLYRREGPSGKVGRWVAPQASINYFLVCPRTGPAATDALDDIKSRTFISGLFERPHLPTGPHTRAMEEPPWTEATIHH